jgi:hypothetical protein
MSSVLVWREKLRVWQRMTMISVDVDAGTCVVQTPSGRRLYSVTAVKPMSSKLRAGMPKTLGNVDSEFIVEESESWDSALKTKVFGINEYSHKFKESRMKELKELMARNTFKILKRLEAKGSRIYGTRFVDALKNTGKGSEFAKSRLDIQAFNDREKEGIPTRAPTIQRVSQRLILAISA